MGARRVGTKRSRRSRDASAETIAAHGPDSVAFYVSGQCLTEDYYVANKLMKGFIGSANIDTNSRLCMASSVAGHVRAFGEDVVPGVYEDWEEADLVVLVGSNAAWCHPVLHQRLLAARAARGTRIVVLDPRRTATAEAADLHLPLAPGSDVMLFNGLLAHLADSGALDQAWLAAPRSGARRCARGRARGGRSDFEAVAAECGVDPEALETFYEWFARTERVAHRLFAGREPVLGRDRQGQRDHQLPSRHRPDRPSRHGAVLRHRPAERDGRARGRRARQPARRAYAFRPSRAIWTRCAGSGARPISRRSPA